MILRWLEEPGHRGSSARSDPWRLPAVSAPADLAAGSATATRRRDPFADRRRLPEAPARRLLTRPGAGRRLGSSHDYRHRHGHRRDRPRSPRWPEPLADLDGVSEVYSVAGDADLIAIVRVREFDQIAEVIAGRLSKVPGVVHTDTHIAFRAYSRHDLESPFSIGF